MVILINFFHITGILHAFPENEVEKEGLKKVLTDLEKTRICPGVTCKESQKYAPIRIPGTCYVDKYYRQVVSGKLSTRQQFILIIAYWNVSQEDRIERTVDMHARVCNLV